MVPGSGMGKSHNVVPEQFSNNVWAVISTPKGRDNPVFKQLAEVTHIHIHGLPFVWAIKLAIECAPKLRQIRVIPSMLERLHPDSHLKMCAERGIEVITGHLKPELVWADGENRSPQFDKQRQFFLNLQGEQKALWDELLAMDFEAALITSRYFCLNGEKYISKGAAAQEFGYSVHNATNVAGYIISGVIVYLDPSFKTRPEARQRARHTNIKVRIWREYLEKLDGKKKFAAELGLEAIPEHLPISRYSIFKKLLVAWQSGAVEELLGPTPRYIDVLNTRFGLESGQYLTLEQAGEKMGGLTRERIRQLEDIALNLLGISNDE